MIMHLGNLNLEKGAFLAPLCGITTRPFRKICRRMGASIVYSETISAEGIGRMNARTLELTRFDEIERPMGIQIFGSDPERIALAAKIVEDLVHPDLIDLNFGCPVPKFVKNDKGAALLRDPARIGRIVRATVKAVSLPISAKMRAGWDHSTIVVSEVAKMVEGEGGCALTVHGRTRAQGYSGEANWEWIADAVKAVSIPIIGNGDVTDAPTAEKRMTESGCAAVMVGRGSIGNPWVFREIAQWLEGGEVSPTPGPAERLEVCLNHLKLQVEDRGELKGIREFRRHLSAYSRGLPGSAAFRDRVNRIEDKDELIERLKEFYKSVGKGDRENAA